MFISLVADMKYVAICSIKFLIALFLVTLVVFTFGCNNSNEHEVTFEQLVSNPNQYDGKDIILEGFFFHGFEIQVIVERLDYSGYSEGHLVPKGEMIWIEGGMPSDVHEAMYIQDMMGPEERYGKVRMTGKFEFGEQYGHLGSYNLQIVPSEVELLEWSQPEP